MKAVAGCLLLAVASATPVDKVITLLTKLTAQVQGEGIAEAASYDKYSCFCKAQATDKVYVIAKSDKKIKEFDAEIDFLTEEITGHNDVVKSKKQELAKEENTREANQKARNKEQEAYEKKRKEAAQAVAAVDGALETMRASKTDVDEELASLIQKVPKLSSMPALALIAGASAGKRYVAAPGEAHAYKYVSKEVMAILGALLQTFKKELADLDQTDLNARDSFQMQRGARANKITAIEKKINEQETLSASKGEEKSDKEQLRDQETTARNSDQAFLNDLTSRCEDKAKAWDQRSTTRASELTALTQAIASLKGMGDLYNANAKLVGFLQLRSVRRVSVDTQKLQSLTNHLKQKAQSFGSAPLAMLALQLEIAGPDHFVKVRGLIKDLISKLKADAAAEATQKGTCDKNMKRAVDSRDKHAALGETARAQIDTTGSNINTLENDIVDLAKEIAGLNKELNEAATLRAGEKADNAETVKNANAGKDAVDQATTTLNKFYGSQLLQAGAGPKKHIKNRDGQTVGDLAPDTFSSDEEYKGKGDSSKGIIGMMEVISSDFARTAQVTTKAEADALKDYTELKTDTEKTLKDKSKLKATKQGDVKTAKSDLTGFKDDLKDATLMNEQALDQLEKLKAACVDGSETYAERVQHRKEEIEALKQAMELLDTMQD